MNVSDFDKWRDDYDAMDVEDHRAFWERFSVDHPKQRYTHHEVLSGLVSGFSGSVCEIGGWDGFLASAVLGNNDKITSWCNYDLLDVGSVCSDPRYRLVVVNALPWEMSFEGDLCVMGHVAEHMRQHHLMSTLANINGNRVFIEVPELQKDWRGTLSTHILECDFDELCSMVSVHFSVSTGTVENRHWIFGER